MHYTCFLLFRIMHDQTVENRENIIPGTLSETNCLVLLKCVHTFFKYAENLQELIFHS